MTEEVQNLSVALGKPRETGSDEVRFNCPFCLNDKKGHLYFNVKKKMWLCFRCGNKGGYASLCYKVRLDPVTGSENLIRNEKWDALLIRLNPDLRVIEEKIMHEYPCEVDTIIETSVAYMYLKRRGYTIGQVRHHGMVSGSFAGCPRVFIPINDDEGDMECWVGRRVVGSGPKYCNPAMSGGSHIFNLEKIPHGADRIIICEGVFSALAAGPDAVAILGKLCSRGQLNRLLEKRAKEYVVSLDGDAVGKALDLYYRLSSFGVNVSFVDMPYEHDPDSDPEYERRLDNRSAPGFTLGDKVREIMEI